MRSLVFGLIAVCAAASGSLLLSGGPSPARAQTPEASPAQIDSLIEDIKAHKQMCDKVDASQEALVRQCNNEQTALVARQQRLGISDEALNAKLKTRGWRWP
jgi:outer membrane murein-binding lipoprotein Lpp